MFVCLILCVPVDLFILLLALLSIIGTVQLLVLWTAPGLIAALFLGCLSYGLVRLLIMLLGSLIGKKDPTKEETAFDNNSELTATNACENHMRIWSNEPAISVSNSIDYLWKQGSESDWLNALEHYYLKLSDKARTLDAYLETIRAEEVQAMSVEDFYSFLHDKYYVWKYTGSYLPRRQRDMQKYVAQNNLNELSEIKYRLFVADRNDIDACLQIAMRIHGLGVAGASGLLSILFPENFGTVDKFLIIALSKISDWEYENELARINPNDAISRKNGVFLIKLLQGKAAELNKAFGTDFWTPRKIDMVLWAIER